jgi:hypothetical protein
MKKLIMMAVVLLLLFPKNIKAQDDGVVAAATGLLAIGSAIVATQQIKESLELRAVEYVLREKSDFIDFDLSTNSLNGVKANDLSNVGVVTYEIINNVNNQSLLLFAFTSEGWWNEHGVDYSKILWKFFDRKSYAGLLAKYLTLAVGEGVSEMDVATGMFLKNGFKKNNEDVLKFNKMDGDSYLVSDYSEDFKIVYNERAMGLFLKETYDLLQLNSRTVIRNHEFLFPNPYKQNTTR